jgi:DNA-binding NtrC family response regulator
MSNTDAAILEAVESFVEQLRGLIQQAALESVQAALNGGSLSARRGLKPARVAPASAPKRRRIGPKRLPEELDALVKKLHVYVAKNPGQRIEQIGRGLDISTKELALPVKKLKSERQISTKGQKRATVYFAK